MDLAIVYIYAAIAFWFAGFAVCTLIEKGATPVTSAMLAFFIGVFWPVVLIGAVFVKKG